jgi:hypothetical protein
MKSAEGASKTCIFSIAVKQTNATGTACAEANTFSAGFWTMGSAANLRLDSHSFSVISYDVKRKIAGASFSTVANFLLLLLSSIQGSI